jgi:Xaa-Pro dipeptidase
MMYAGMAKIKAGNTTRDICEQWPDSPTYWGYEPDEWDKVSPHAVGHGIGLSLHEYPLFSRPGMGGDAKLEEGMVLAVETWCGKKGGDFGIRLEENVVVRKDGYELLTKFPIDELIECPF